MIGLLLLPEFNLRQMEGGYRGHTPISVSVIAVPKRSLDVGHRGQTFPRHVVDDVEHAEPLLPAPSRLRRPGQAWRQDPPADDRQIGFAEARDEAGPACTPSRFHEIRSLAARLYVEQGTDAQARLGHKSPDMTAVYRNARGAEWGEVRTV